MNYIEISILETLNRKYQSAPMEYVHFNVLYDTTYYQLIEDEYEEYANGGDFENHFIISLNYLIGFGHILHENSYYRLTPLGKDQWDNPPINYSALSLQEDRTANNYNRIVTAFGLISLIVSIASLYIAWLALSLTS